ncbi:MAG: helix-turn-helix domain-containing protein, partial [Bdellovibrionales bacterium]|nr:helix-turn-helix domain-containing protein [Bdellovibrionales bacterium]
EWIKENIWDNADISPRSIDAQISKLKKILPEIGQDIINIYGQGYILTPDNKQAA